MTMENAPQKLLVEALGTFALCFMGIGAIILTQGQDVVAIALAHGIAIAVMFAAASHISGGHFNPAITLGTLAARRMPAPDAIAYIVAQLVGAVAGAGALTLTYLDVDRNAVDLGLPRVGASITADPIVQLSSGNALAMEAILTFFLVLVFFGTALDRRSAGRWVGPLAIGLTVTTGVLAGWGVSGAAMNPARWFGPAVIQQEFDDFWIWIVGPVVGGVVAALLYSEFLSGRAWGQPGDEGDVDVVEEVDVVAVVPAARRRTKRRRQSGSPRGR